MYEMGRGTPQNFTEAATLYKKAAQKGYGKAQCRLGGLYHGGLGIGQSAREAIRCFQSAGEQDDNAGLHAGSNNSGPRSQAEVLPDLALSIPGIRLSKTTSKSLSKSTTSGSPVTAEWDCTPKYSERFSFSP